MSTKSGKPYEAEVQGYLADCQRCSAQLSPVYHPTAKGAVKLIPHRGDLEEAELIRQTFASLTGIEAGQ